MSDFVTRRDVITKLAPALALTVPLGMTSGVLAADVPAAPLPAFAGAFKDGAYVLPPLPYPYDALEPHIDAETMKLHHDKHHKAYVDNWNKANHALAELRAAKEIDQAKLN